jgi:hypothetical protein
MPRFSFSDIIGVAGMVLAFVLIVLDKAGKLKGHWLYILLAVAAFMTLFIAIGNTWVMDAALGWRIWRGSLMFCTVVLTYSGIALWISPVPRSGSESAAAPLTSPKKLPSFVFVFGAPLGDNKSSTWIMMLKHFGPESAHNCTVEFFDDDRKNLEHGWLVKHPNSPFLPPGLFDESQKSLHIAEAAPEGSIGSFNWSPLDPDRQHYTVSINCRDGVFVERWEVTRVEGVLRAKITIEHGPQWVEKNPTLERIVFKCEDPEFTGTPLAAKRPERNQPNVHPGWKPSHRFEVPVAIIDPNGHVQVMSGVKLPDGSTATDFGCWNILTKHFGDN